MNTPLGIADLLHSSTEGKNMPVPPWYWCRRHERAEHVSEPTLTTTDAANYHADMMRVGEPGVTKPERPQPCVRVGPFMSEREADRLSGIVRHSSAPYGLGMEMEQ